MPIDHDEKWAIAPNGSNHTRNDYTDVNYVRTHFWELSGKPSSNPITFWMYNGTHFTHNLKLFTKASLYPEIIKALKTLYPNTKSIFMGSDANKTILLIYSDGKTFEKPEPFKHKSFNNNPFNDWDFMDRLPVGIKKAKDKASNMLSEPFKAWINVRTGIVYQFTNKKDETHQDILKAHAELFDIDKNQTLLQALVQVEQQGWVMVDIGVANKVQTIQITALNLKQAQQAAKITTKYRAPSSWNVLLLKTNQNSLEINKNFAILNFINSGDVSDAIKISFI